MFGKWISIFGWTTPLKLYPICMCCHLQANYKEKVGRRQREREICWILKWVEKLVGVDRQVGGEPARAVSLQLWHVLLWLSGELRQPITSLSALWPPLSLAGSPAHKPLALSPSRRTPHPPCLDPLSSVWVMAWMMTLTPNPGPTQSLTTSLTQSFSQSQKEWMIARVL